MIKTKGLHGNLIHVVLFVFIGGQATVPWDARTAHLDFCFCLPPHNARRERGCHFFVIPQRNGERKGTKGPNALWIPAVRLCGRGKRAARRKSEHLQLLRLQVKETCKHGSSSDSALTNDVSFCLSPCDRRKLKQDGIAKTFASANPSWACAYAPKMEEAC